MHIRTRPSKEVVVVLSFSLPLLVAFAARADLLSRLSLGGEAGAGTMLAAYQRDQLHERFALQGSLRVGLTIADPLAAQLVGRTWWFPSSAGYGRATQLGAG